MGGIFAVPAMAAEWMGRVRAARTFMAGSYKLAGGIFLLGGIEAAHGLRQGKAVLAVGA